MNGIEARRYNKRLQKLEQTYLALLDEYQAQPFKLRASSHVEHNLTSVECALLDNPPLERRAVLGMGGQRRWKWLKRAKGLPPVRLCENKLPALPKPPTVKEGLRLSVPVREWDDWLEGEDRVDLRVVTDFQLDQNGDGSCAAEAIAGVYMGRRRYQGQETVLLNPLFLYHETSGGDVDRGSTLHDNLAKIVRDGCASEAVWPRRNGWRRRPSDEAYEDAKKYRVLEYHEVTSWEEFGTALLLGFPVYFGYPGHAIWATKLLSTTRFEYANSWGNGWGDNGFGTLSKDRIEWGYGAYAARLVMH